MTCVWRVCLKVCWQHHVFHYDLFSETFSGDEFLLDMLHPVTTGEEFTFACGVYYSVFTFWMHPFLPPPPQGGYNVHIVLLMLFLRLDKIFLWKKIFYQEMGSNECLGQKWLQQCQYVISPFFILPFKSLKFEGNRCKQQSKYEYSSSCRPCKCCPEAFIIILFLWVYI